MVDCQSLRSRDSKSNMGSAAPNDLHGRLPGIAGKWQTHGPATLIVIPAPHPGRYPRYHRSLGWDGHHTMRSVLLFVVWSGRNMVMTPETRHDDPFKKATTANQSARLFPKPDHRQDAFAPPKSALAALGNQTTNTARRDPSCERYWKQASSAHSSTGHIVVELSP